MYLDFLVKIPDERGKITYRSKGETEYVYYEYDREYDKEKQQTNPKRATIGKRSKADSTMMQPNEKFLRYFPDATLPEEKDRTVRSSCLRIGSFIVIRKIMQDYGLFETLGRFFDGKELGVFLDLVAYSLITEHNAAQYYPDYAYNHPLFTKDMRIYSDSKVSDFLHSITEDQSVGFLNEWNGRRDHREKIYLTYDSTNKACQAGEIEMAEYGHAKVDMGLPIFNYAVAYDTKNQEPLFYEKYPGSINDVSQLQFMLDKASGYGYRRLGFILDRGYFSKQNIERMDAHGYPFIIMVKGMASFVNELIMNKKGTFENKRKYHIEDYGVYGISVKKKLHATDKKDRYFHIYHSIQKESGERTELETKVRRMKTYLRNHENQVREFGPSFEKYFILHYDEKTGVFQFQEERIRTIEREIDLCGYFCIITSEKMSTKEALHLYKSRDASEKLFRGDKSYLGNKSLRVHANRSVSAKIFIEFIALIIRNKIYTYAKDEMKRLDKKPNYLTVPALIRELEKIELVRQTDNVYRLDHAVTATQKSILAAFGLDVPLIKYHAQEISKQLTDSMKSNIAQ